jgi:hypothetical protein
MEQQAAQAEHRHRRSAGVQFTVERRQRFLIGALLAASLIILEIGLAHVWIGLNPECLSPERALPDIRRPRASCPAEGWVILTQALAAGPRGVIEQADLTLTGLIGVAMAYGLVGGVAAQFSARLAVLGMAALHLLYALALGLLNYLFRFLVF